MAHRPARGPHSLRARPARAAVVPAGDDANAPLRCRGLVGGWATAFDRIDLVAIDGRAGGARPGLWRVCPRVAPAHRRRRRNDGLRLRLAGSALLARARSLCGCGRGLRGAHRAGAEHRRLRRGLPWSAASWLCSRGRAARISGATGPAAIVPMPCRRNWCRTGSRTRSRLAHEPLAVAAFTMSNSAVFFVPAARCCARVLAFPFASTPNEGWAERRQAHYVCCRVCETRRVRASEARRVP